MLINPNFELVADESAVFVLSVWHELFYGFTPDSCQPRLHNVPSLIDELAAVAARWATEPLFKNQVLKIKAELKAVMLSEKDLLDSLPSYRSHCEVLVNAKTAQTIVCGARLLTERKEEYLACLQQSARDAISGLPKTKKLASLSLRRLATFAFQNGQEDDDVWRPFIDCEHQSASSLFDKIVQVTNRPKQVYSVLLTVIGEYAGMNSLSRFCKYEVLSRKKLEREYLDAIGPHASNILYVRQTIEETSIRRAVDAARKRLGSAVGLVSLYKNPDNGIKIHPAAFVDVDNQSVTLIQTEQAFRRLHPRKNAAERAKEAAKTIAASRNTDERLLAAIEQLAYASSSGDSRTRFVNLWAAVETLAGAHEGETTLERVCELIVPLVVSRHTHRTTRYLTILTENIKREMKIGSLGPGFSRPQQCVEQEEMLIALASPENDPKIADLLAAIEHPHLRWKLHHAWSVFHSRRLLKTRLTDSKERLEWHLARIYRARNMLVHEGIETPFIVPLLDNLQNYLSTLTQRLIHELQEHPDWTIRQVLEYWNGRMNHILTGLSTENVQQLVTSDFLEGIKAPKQIWFASPDSDISD